MCVRASEVTDALRHLLPSCARVAGGLLLDNPPPLSPKEMVSAGQMNSGRDLEFRTGRAYAKAALAQLSFHDVELPRSKSGSPRWPDCVTGSISHSGNLFATAVVRKQDFCRVGIDIEQNRPIHPRVWKQYLNKAELAAIHHLPVPARSEFALSSWCTKEAFIKAFEMNLDPTVISVRRIERLTGSLEPYFARDVWEITTSGSPLRRWQAHSLICNDFIVASTIS